MKKLFIPEECEESYLRYLDEGFDAINDTTKNIDERAELANESMVTAAENADRSLESEEGFKLLEAQLGKVKEFLDGDKAALAKLLDTAGVAQDIYQHGSNVAGMSICIAEKVGIRDPQKLLDLGIASLLHDAGKESLGFGAMTAIKDVSKDDLAKFHTHGEISAEKIKDKPYVSDRVIELIVNHEEYGAGLGYPQKRNIDKLQRTSQVLNLCNAFDRFCIDHQKVPREAFASFFEANVENFPEKHLTVLEDVISQN